MVACNHSKTQSVGEDFLDHKINLTSIWGYFDHLWFFDRKNESDEYFDHFCSGQVHDIVAGEASEVLILNVEHVEIITTVQVGERERERERDR